MSAALRSKQGMGNMKALALAALLLAGCANSPFYVSQISASAEQDNGVNTEYASVTILPNPAYHYRK